VFERFTERARQVVVLAQDESRALGDAFISTDHLLLGLAREQQGIGARALQSFDLTLERLRDLLRPDREHVVPPITGQIPFTPRAKASLEQALHQATELGHGFIGTEHLLLGVLRAGEESTIDALKSAGVTPKALRDRVLELCAGSSTHVASAARFTVAPLEGSPASWPPQLDRVADAGRLVAIVQDGVAFHAVFDRRP
jgi:ATP-dependent Clp protease ATP-binding subunit ClpC